MGGQHFKPAPNFQSFFILDYPPVSTHAIFLHNAHKFLQSILLVFLPATFQQSNKSTATYRADISYPADQHPPRLKHPSSHHYSGIIKSSIGCLFSGGFVVISVARVETFLYGTSHTKTGSFCTLLNLNRCCNTRQ